MDIVHDFFIPAGVPQQGKRMDPASRGSGGSNFCTLYLDAYIFSLVRLSTAVHPPGWSPKGPSSWHGGPGWASGCKNKPTPFPGQMSYKATKPGSVLSYLSMFSIMLFIKASFMYC